MLWGGPGLHIVHYPLRHSAVFNIVAVFRTATHAEKGDFAVLSRGARTHLPQRASDHAALIGMMDLARRAAVADRDPVRHWHKGRVVLLGDAAHAPLQSLAQGACMAIEDGLCLAELIDASDGDFAAAFRRFEAVAAVAHRAGAAGIPRRSGTSTTLDEGIARDVRNATVADWDEAHMFDCLSWLYDGCPRSGRNRPLRLSTFRQLSILLLSQRISRAG